MGPWWLFFPFWPKRRSFTVTIATSVVSGPTYTPDSNIPRQNYLHDHPAFRSIDARPYHLGNLAGKPLNLRGVLVRLHFSYYY